MLEHNRSFEMNCQTEGDRLSQRHWEDGDGDSDGSFETEQGSSLPLSQSVICHSKDPSLALSSAELISDEDHTDGTPIMSLQFSRSARRRKGRWDEYHRSYSKIFLSVVVTVMLLSPSLISATSRSNDHVILLRGKTHSYSREQIWSETQQRWRFLQDENDTIADAGDVIESEPSDEPIVENASNQTESPVTNQTEPTSSDDEDELETIEVLLPPGVTQEDEDVADVIDSLIPPVNTTVAPTFSPTAPSAPTVIPLSLDPTPPPSISFAPSPAPTTSPQPTMTMSPTFSPAPSFGPSVSPSSGPTATPTATFEPSHPPSFAPTISPKPSGFPSFRPTDVPSVSVFPSLSPTISPQPTISAFPSMGPTNYPTSAPSPAPTPEATDTAVISDNEMILRNVPYNLDNLTEPIWENVTSQHIVNYYEKFSKTFTTDFAFEIVNVETTLVKSEIVPEIDGVDDAQGDDAQGEDVSVAARQDQTAELPQNDATKKLTLKITYHQKVFYESDEVTMPDEDLSNRLFVIPFTTDSFHYSMDLYTALNWTTWVMVETVIDSPPTHTLQPSQQPPQLIASKLTSAQTFAISASTIIAACLIVLFLLWERNQKGDIHFGMNSPRGEGSSSEDSRMHAMQGTPMEGSGFYYNDRSESVTDDTAYASASIRSAPGHLRRNSIDRGMVHRRESFLEDHRRGRLGSQSDISASSKGKFGTMRSAYSKASSNSSNADNNDQMSPKQRSPRGQERYGSPGIPLQVPIRSTSASANRNNKSDKNDRPFLPPLPPPTSFGSDRTPERSRPDSLEQGVVLPLKDTSASNQSTGFGRATSAFRRPSNRAFGMRLSGVANDDMTEISILTDPFPSDRDNRRYSGDFVIPNSQFNDDSGRSRFEQYLSPLHIPDEEIINRAPIDPLLAPTPESPIMSTMLGLESMRINDALTPV